MSKEKKQSNPENLPEETHKTVNMFDKFTRALEMDRKGTPRNAIYNELDISSATLYKWLRNPQKWAEKYKAKPEKLMRTTKEIIKSIKHQESSFSTIKSLLSDLDLNEYELEFMYHYIHKRNSTEAVLRCLPPENMVTRQTVKIRGLKLMQRNSIREGINRIMQWELDGIQMTLANDIVSQLYRMAFYDPAMFIDGQGNSRFKTIDDIPEEYRCCVAGIKKVFHPKDASRIHYEIQLTDRKVAMRELMEYANLYESTNTGAHALGEGLKKIADLLEKSKNDAVDMGMKNVTPVQRKIG